MTHKDIYKEFNQVFKDLSSTVEMWFPNGKNSIRVRDKYKAEYIFTFNSPRNWSIETVENFIAKLKGDKRR